MLLGEGSPVTDAPGSVPHALMSRVEWSTAVASCPPGVGPAVPVPWPSGKRQRALRAQRRAPAPSRQWPVGWRRATRQLWQADVALGEHVEHVRGSQVGQLQQMLGNADRIGHRFHSYTPRSILLAHRRSTPVKSSRAARWTSARMNGRIRSRQSSASAGSRYCSWTSLTRTSAGTTALERGPPERATPRRAPG
jgi:hypothetical protein